MEFHDDYPQYELMAHHSEEEGKVKRKKLWRVFWIMLCVTLIELWIGFKWQDWGISKFMLIVIFVFFTIVKASYIVLSFMHLGDEKKAFRYTVLAPYTLFAIYLIYIVMIEGTYVKDYRMNMDKKITDQRDQQRQGGAHH